MLKPSNFLVTQFFHKSNHSFDHLQSSLSSKFHLESSLKIFTNCRIWIQFEDHREEWCIQLWYCAPRGINRDGTNWSPDSRGCPYCYLDQQGTPREKKRIHINSWSATTDNVWYTDPRNASSAWGGSPLCEPQPRGTTLHERCDSNAKRDQTRKWGLRKAKFSWQGSSYQPKSNSWLL